MSNDLIRALRDGHTSGWTSASAQEVRRIVDQHPEQLREKIEHGFRDKGLPLHYACLQGCPENIMRLLVEAYPMALKEKDQINERLPIHHACSERNSIQVVRLLIEMYPESIQEVDRYGTLPIHHACCQYASADVVQMLVEAYPESPRETTRSGYLPVHFACMYSRNLIEVLPPLAVAYPESFQKEDKDGYLPIHLACKNCATIEILRILIGVYPESLRERDRQGYLPIAHCAGDRRVPIEVIQFLLDADPTFNEYDGSELDRVSSCHGEVFWRLFQQREEGGDGAYMRVVEELVLRSVGIPDDMRQSKFLLHACCFLKQYPRSCSFFPEIFFIRHAELIQQRDSVGNSIMHTLVRVARFPMVVCLLSSLCRKHPELAWEMNDNGDLPIHVACKSEGSLGLIRKLLTHSPKLAFATNAQGQLPLHVALNNDSADGGVVEIARWLMKAHPPAVSKKDPTTNLSPFLAAARANFLDLTWEFLVVDPAVIVKDGR